MPEEIRKVSDDWEREDVQKSVLLTGEACRKVMEACVEFDRISEDIINRFEAIKNGFTAEMDTARAKVSELLAEELKGTSLEGQDPYSLNVDTRYAQKFSQILVSPRLQQARDFGSILKDLLGSHDVIEIGGK